MDPTMESPVIKRIPLPFPSLAGAPGWVRCYRAERSAYLFYEDMGWQYRAGRYARYGVSGASSPRYTLSRRSLCF